MGKSLNGKELGQGISQRKDGFIKQGLLIGLERDKLYIQNQ